MALRLDDVDLGRDRALVERYQAGDDAAFDDLYSRYFRRLHRYCARRVHDFDTAEEIAQEAFVRALQALPRLNGDRRFYPWMTVIASRLCVDHHRRCQRTQPSDDIDAGVVPAEIDHVFHAVDHAHLATALERVNPRHRRVLELREREGLSYEDIAERMEVTLGTVEALLHRARKALRREFLAVADEPRYLAGVPVIGVLLRGMDRLRSRMAEISSLGQSVAIGVASVAMMVAPGVFSDHPETSPREAGTQVVTSAAGLKAPDLSASVDGATPMAPTAGRSAGAVDTGGAGGSEAGQPVTVRSPDVSVGDPDGRQRAASQPLADWLGPLLIGANPAQISDDTSEELADLLEFAR